ncbi:MAG: amino acid ABC transporter permease [Spirochaetales bacterium]|nr:amino acid ABC transporter permease [Spirochaetales bacterium]
MGIIFLLRGLGTTLTVTFAALIIGMVLGIGLALMKLSSHKLIKTPAVIYISIIRGTPAVVQLMIIYFIIFASVNIDKTVIGCIAFGINSSAYIAEIIRSGIQAVDKGQMEAGRSLGLNHTQTMSFIIMPQAVKNILPALGNEFIVLLKETSILGFIGGVDLMRRADMLRSTTYNATIPLITAALIYLTITLTLSGLLHLLERRLNHNDRS